MDGRRKGKQVEDFELYAWELCGVCGINPNTRGLTLRQLVVMARARWEMEGEVAAFIVQGVTLGRIKPEKILGQKDLNPFRERETMSEAMKKHLEGWERDKWVAMVRSSQNAGR